jgi:hypothetical protein
MFRRNVFYRFISRYFKRNIKLLIVLKIASKIVLIILAWLFHSGCV